MIRTERVKAFHDRLRRDGGYRTAPASARPLGRFDAYFYLRLAGIIYSGHRFGRRGELDAMAWAAHSFAVFELLEACGARIEIIGMDRPLALGGPTVYVANHMSLVETLLLPSMLAPINLVAVVVKESLLRYPFFGTVLGAVRPIAVGRRNPREDLRSVLAQGKEAIDAGRSVLIFPQSTRSAVFDPAAFNSLGVKLAKTAGALVTPIALKTDFLANGRILKDLGRLDRRKTVHFRFGEPVAADGKAREAHGKVTRFIADSLKAWGA